MQCETIATGHRTIVESTRRNCKQGAQQHTQKRSMHDNQDRYPDGSLTPHADPQTRETQRFHLGFSPAMLSPVSPDPPATIPAPDNRQTTQHCMQETSPGSEQDARRRTLVNPRRHLKSTDRARQPCEAPPRLHQVEAALQAHIAHSPERRLGSFHH